MNEILYILLGAAVALFGSFISKRFEFELSREGQDKALLVQLAESFLDYSSYKGDQWKEDEISDAGFVEMDEKEKQILWKMKKTALMLNSKKYTKLARDITKIGLFDYWRTKENVDCLTERVIRSTNERMHNELDREMKKLKPQLQRAIDNNDHEAIDALRRIE